MDVLIVPGGFGVRPLLERPAVLGWVVERSRQARQLASVCTGSLLLARAGLLRGRRATTHWGSHDRLAALDPSITVERGARVVEDGVVTSAGVAAGMDMAFTLVTRFCGEAVARDTAHYIEYPWPGLAASVPAAAEAGGA
jgi:transcriptional regulator GlxA family with amidase domain